MGHKTQEINSGALSAEYPAIYHEWQVRNWSKVDIVVTYFNGDQDYLPGTTQVRDSDASVELEYRHNAGMRREATKFGMKDIPIKGQRICIPYELIRNGPYRVPELNIIVSTYDHAYVARDMVFTDAYNPVLYETRIDEDILDPRLCFRIDDPGNQWSELYVNLFGQTFVLRAGHWADALPMDEKPDENAKCDKGRLICYLRYPNDYIHDGSPVTTVFEVSLENVQTGEPIMLPGGDVICVAPTYEELRTILAKKEAGHRGQIPANLVSSKMVPKEIYDAAQSNFKDELERAKLDRKNAIETLTLQKNREIAELKDKLSTAERQAEALKTQCEQWEAISKARATAQVDQAAVLKAQAEARKEAAEAARKEVDNQYALLKICGSIVAGVLSYALTAYAKSKKK